MATIAEALALAIEHHQSGRLPEAEELYRRILAVDPENAQTRYLLGLLAAQVGRFDLGALHLGDAVALAPDMADAHLRRAMALDRLDRVAESAVAYHRALTLRPGQPQMWINLAVALRRLGRAGEAETAYRRAVAGDSTLTLAHVALGELRLGAGDPAAAVAAFDVALGLDAGQAAAWQGLAAARQQLGDDEGAVAALRRLVALCPLEDGPPARLGVLLQAMGRHREAVGALHRALVLVPDWAEVWHAMGLSIAVFGGPAPSLPVQRRAVLLNPRMEAARLHHAFVLHDLRRLGAAQAALRRVLAVTPTSSEALCFLSSVQRDLDQHGAANDSARRAVCAAPGAEAPWRTLSAGIVYDPDLDTDERFAVQRWLADMCAPRVAPRPLGNDPDPNRRLRVGYLSSDLHTHPVTRNLEPLVALHDRSRFDLYFYADVEVLDATSERLRAMADGWRGIVGLDDAAVAEMIRADGIDVLVILAARFDRNRPLVAVHRPAPVQVSFFDVATTGLDAMDALIADRVLLPRHAGERFSERVIRLPVYYGHAPMEEVPEPGPLPAPSQGGLTFGSFNNPVKFNGAVLDLWARMLAAVPGSRLVMKYLDAFGEPALRARVLAPFERHGLADRVELIARRQSRAEHLALYRRIDVALDPFPFSGSTTTFEALWMGVPVITRPVDAMVSRWAASMLRCVGLSEFTTGSDAAFIALARRCDADRDWLAGIRAGLRERVRASALTDTRWKTRHLERAYRALWRRWCAGQAVDWLAEGTARLGRGEAAGARDAYARAQAANPGDGEALYALALAAQRLGDAAAAERAYRRAVRLRPDDWRPVVNLAVLLQEAGRPREAAAVYRRMLALVPDRAAAWHALGAAAAAEGGPPATLPPQRRAVRLDPELDAARLAHAVALYDLGRVDEAAAALRRVLALDPALGEGWCLLASATRMLGDAAGGTALNRRALAADPASQTARRGLLAALLYDPTLDEAARFAEHRRLAAGSAAAAPGGEGRHANPPDPRRRLRVGYVSSDLRAHPVAANLEPILIGHDRGRVELFAYADVDAPDAVTARLRPRFAHWRDTAGLDDAALARAIRADRIDVLVIVAGRFDRNRPGLAAHRPAPVQISLYDGATSGHAAMDAILTDPVMTPRHGAERFSERPVRLPALFAYGPLTQAPDPAPPPVLASGRVTFASLNNPAKVNDGVLDLWARVLDAVPGSRLVLKYKAVYGAPDLRRRVLDRFAGHGVAADRIVMPAASQESARHLALYHGVDVALDPFPFCGATTTYEALYMGVPVVTLPGTNMMGRWSASLLRVVGCGELIAADAGDYVRIAASLAADRARLTRLHAELRGRLLAAPILDPARKARQVERIMRALWRRWCAGHGQTAL